MNYIDFLGLINQTIKGSKNLSSMHQDLIKNKKTEIDYINGSIVRHGQSLGIPTPVNLTLFELVKTLEASYHQRIL